MGSQDHGQRRRQVAARHLVDDPGALYDRARAVAAARVPPAYVAYDLHARFRIGRQTRAEDDHVVLRVADGAAAVTTRDGATHVRSQAPYVYPFRTFGLAPEGANEPVSTFEANAATPAPQPGEIGRVRATRRVYDVADAGSESVGNATVEHLVLTPRFDPETNRLRGIWVDPATGETLRIQLQITEHRGPVMVRPLVTVDYAPLGRTYVIVAAHADAVSRVLLLAISGTGTLRIENVEIPATPPPDALFRATP